MFVLLIGVGALFLAVFVSAILDPRWSHTGGAGERTRANDGSDYVVDDMLRHPRRDAAGFCPLPGATRPWRPERA
jgi:hypothetical protein